MTNAEKYRLTGIEAYNLSQELGEYLTIEKKAEGVFVSDINSFFVRATQPTLTEDERVILRNIDSAFSEIRRTRHTDGGHTQVLNKYMNLWFDFMYHNLFQFIKERRRI